MSIRGDMQASLVSKGFTWEQATIVVKDVIETIQDPNFANRYAIEETDDEDEHNEFMCRYWSVTSFLKRLV
jgi:hypothetical protein